jgi:hypothetical protein
MLIPYLHLRNVIENKKIWPKQTVMVDVDDLERIVDSFYI